MKDDLNLSNSNPLSFGMVEGFEMLLVAYRYAQEVRRDLWEFAVEIQCLRDAGMNNAELRWLVCKGLVQHAEEENNESNMKSRRVFRKVGDLTLLQRSCFVLTKKGFEASKHLLPDAVAH